MVPDNSSIPPNVPERFRAPEGLPKWLRDILEASLTFHSMMREGFLEGYTSGQRETLLDVLHERFGSVPSELEVRIAVETHYDRLRSALRQALHINAPDELTL